MNTTRRNFLGLSTLFLLSNKSIFASVNDSLNIRQDNLSPINTQKQIIKPRALKKGSTIAITAPASAANVWECKDSINFFKKLGCNVIIGDTINNSSTKYRYLSAPDDVRAGEFMKFIEKKDVDCVLCARGGYGSMRILPLLDYDMIKNNPKIIIGYSDITALIIAINKICNLITFHGAIASSIYNKYSDANLINTLFHNDKFTPLKITYPTITTLNKGTAEGRIVGGNLTVITATLGTPYEIDTQDAILLLEEVSEEPYKVDRMLTQLWLAGKLQSASAIAFGSFKNLDSRRCFYPYKSYTIREIIEQRIIPLKKPTIMGLPFGHTEDKLTLPIGIKAALDATKKTFTILEPAVT